MKRTVHYIAIFTAILLIACENSTTSQDSSEDDFEAIEDLESRTFYAGISGLVPKNYPNPSNSDWSDLFNSLPDYGDYLGMHVGWNQGELDQHGVPEIIELAYNITSETTITPYIAIGFEPDHLTNQEADNYFQENGEAFIEVTKIIAETYQPDILIIGIEINRYFEKSASGFIDFITSYHEVYSTVKSVSPNTIIGTNFLLDFMKGDGIRSGVQRTPQWELISLFEPNIDLVTFTVFPFLDYNHPNAIPANYLQEITDYTDRPLMITETGWPSEPVTSFPAISASEELQADYLYLLLDLIESLPLHSLIWVYPHDPETGIAGGLFDYLSLKKNDGTPKLVFEDWTELISKPVEN